MDSVDSVNSVNSVNMGQCEHGTDLTESAGVPTLDIHGHGVARMQELDQ